ncbi:MAG: CRISPR-associated ring nuclease Csm6 [Porticoccaceae bacterium]
MAYSSPEEFPRRILLVVSGMSPQILTETLWALTWQRQPAFVPTEIHLLTTIGGARNARLNLLDKGRFTAFCHDYGLAPSLFDSDSLHTISTGSGRPLEDIRTPEENEAAADFITGFIRDLTRDDDAALHVSMAGGRKTMGYYAGYALSLFGRAQDRLSHVLVSEPFENLPGFYYPTPMSHLIDGPNGRVLDARDAEVTLAEIPFVRLRDEVPTLLLEGRAGFSETIQKAQRLNGEESLVVNIAGKRLIAAGEEVTLPPSLFAFYVWIIRRLLDGDNEPGVRDLAGPNQAYAETFLALFERIEGEMGRDLDRTREALANGMEKGWFDEKKSRVNKALVERLGQSLAKRYQITGFGKHGYTRYTVMLDADQIEWIE